MPDAVRRGLRLVVSNGKRVAKATEAEVPDKWAVLLARIERLKR